MNTLYFGDNINILRMHISDETVDLVYLDPPFNSNRNYNVYLATPKGQQSDAQITAFDDTWHWGDQANLEYSDLLRQPNTDVAALMTALRSVLNETDLMAYLVMMTSRLLELHRVLKPTGSLYLHCDPTASHYLKIVLDAIFGANNFRNHVTWKRSDTHNDAKKRFSAISDHILFYAKSESTPFNVIKAPLNDSHIKNWFVNLEFPDGTIRKMTPQEIASNTVPPGARRFSISDLSSPNPRPNLMYSYKGYPHPAKGWRVSLEKMEQLDRENRLLFPNNPSGRIVKKKYLEEQDGIVLGDVWSDITQLRAQDSERMRYPTQKPLALLERIIQASSNPGDLVLDPFCGCGTAVHAAEKLGRQWIGIDITHLAIHLIERRMKDSFPGIQFDIHGEPKDLESARDLAARDKYEFQFWACSLVGAQPYKGGKKGADSGIDGIIYFQDDKKQAKKIIVSVKGGEHVTRTMIADLKNTVDREGAQIGLFITLSQPTDPMLKEASAAGFYVNPYDERSPKIQILTIADLLDGRKPAYRDFTMGASSFKKARTEKEKGQQPDLFG